MADISDSMIFQYVVRNRYPDEINNLKNGKRRLRSKAKNYCYEGDHLYYTVKTKLEDGRNKRHLSKRIVILNEEEKIQKMTELHASMTGGGHLGREKTLHKVRSLTTIIVHVNTKIFVFQIQERYYWTNMYNDIKMFVKTCNTCQKVNKKFSAANKTLYPIQVEEPKFWHFIAIDCVTNLPLTYKGIILCLKVFKVFIILC